MTTKIFPVATADNGTINWFADVRIPLRPIDLYTEDQLSAAVAAERERIADHVETWLQGYVPASLASDCAAAIREGKHED